MSRLSDFEKLATLGRGSFGVVFKVRRRGNQRLAAYLVLDTDALV
jgi:serine/threonine protein kinase